MKNSTTLYCRPQIVLTPSLKQAISLLSLSAQELTDIVHIEAIQNPLLKISGRSVGSSIDEDFMQIVDNHKMTMASYLEQNLIESHLEPEVKNIFSELIIHINEFGFLPMSYRKALSQDLEEKYLKWVSQLEPLGLGAADLCESLLWQLNQLPFSQEQQELLEFINLIREQKISWHDKELFFRKIEEKSPNITKKVNNLFQKLEIYPAKYFEVESTPDIQAEIILVQENGVFTAELNQDLICHVEVISPKNKKHEQWYSQAQSFKKMIRTRYETLLKVAQFLVAKQQDFFYYDQNPAALKPMQLKELALALHLHESTISRIAQSKYLWTDQGFIPLKLLFARKIYHQEYGSVSTSHVQQCLNSLLKYEDKTHPFSDRQLQDILEKQGYQLARRTIAKYREALGVPNSRKRKLE